MLIYLTIFVSFVKKFLTVWSPFLPHPLPLPFLHPQGSTGAAGAAGATGQKGDKGDTGNSGPRGLSGLDGAPVRKPSQPCIFQYIDDIVLVFNIILLAE